MHKLSEVIYNQVKFDFIELDSMQWHHDFADKYNGNNNLAIHKGKLKQNDLEYHFLIDQFCSLRILTDYGIEQYFKFDQSLKPNL